MRWIRTLFTGRRCDTCGVRSGKNPEICQECEAFRGGFEHTHVASRSHSTSPHRPELDATTADLDAAVPF